MVSKQRPSAIQPGKPSARLEPKGLVWTSQGMAGDRRGSVGTSDADGEGGDVDRDTRARLQAADDSNEPPRDQQSEPSRS